VSNTAAINKLTSLRSRITAMRRYRYVTVRVTWVRYS